jgi:serine/threonine protein phosphatase PrpC
MTESEVFKSEVSESEILNVGSTDETTETEETQTRSWQCFAASVVGASHQRKNPPIPNQDAYRVKPDRTDGIAQSHWVLMVADGHGSHKSFRSADGSRLAVDTAADYLWECFCQTTTGPEGQSVEALSYEAIYDFCQTQLPERLVRGWTEAVKAHLEQHPFTEEQVQLLPTEAEVKGASSSPQSKRLDGNQLRDNYAYGTTLLGVVITDRFILYLQLGDGDIVCVDSTGKAHRPFPKDPTLIANETTSLCLANAWSHFRVKLTPIYGNPPALIFVSTDGYSNSCPTDEDYLETVTDHLRWLQEQMSFGGSQREISDRIEQDLRESLSDVSERGSGDDITVGILATASLISPELSSFHSSAEEPV